MPGPQVTIDLEKIEANTRTVVSWCKASGISIFGVTKGSCGMPQVARAMLRGGVRGLGESRLENIRRLRGAGIDAPVMLLRSPPLSLIDEVIRTVDISLNSELAIIAELSRVAERMGRIHDIILMIDLGDLREGILPTDLIPTIERILEMPGIRIAGLGTNLTCFGAIIPTEVNLGQLADLAGTAQQRFGLDLAYISGGNSSSLPLLLSGNMPKGINHLRIGEAILQGGRDTFLDQPRQELDRDVFLLSGELLEVKMKPSMPIGISGVDAFGGRPVFQDIGERLRGIVNIGREDANIEGLLPVKQGVTVLGASSDHLILDVTDARPVPEVGDRVNFRMSYGALLAAMTSEYVEKLPMYDRNTQNPAARVSIFAEKNVAAALRKHTLDGRLANIGYEVDLTPRVTVDEISASLDRRARPLIFGADHRASFTAMSAVAATLDAFGLLWFDAMASVLPQQDGSESVLYRALGLGPGTGALTPKLSPENVVLIGLRETAPEEVEILKTSRVKIFTIADIDALGMREVIRQAVQIASAGMQGFHVSYNPAVTDIPGYLPGTGGITVRETHQAMEAIHQSKSMRAMDITGLDAEADPRFASMIVHFALSAFGKRIL
ncbi:alanine racemase [Taklimakanibacter lacteus]|uniref:alanine racemase n=1 Tax=Taklimakanibacter lacteus TaxID=2268456 RepID=UPI000E66F697